MRITKQAQIDELLVLNQELAERLIRLEIELKATYAAIDRFQGTGDLADIKALAAGASVEHLLAEIEALRAALEASDEREARWKKLLGEIREREGWDIGPAPANTPELPAYLL